jgi:hypothetical protein
MDNTLILDEIRSFFFLSNILSHNKEMFFFKGKMCQIPNLIKKSNDIQNSWKPLVIIIPLRLGLNDVNSEYIEQLKVNQLNSKILIN